LASPAAQFKKLDEAGFGSGAWPSFQATLVRHGLEPLKPRGVEILQVNLGYMCNQVCAHCHVDAGPDRREQMSSELISRVVEAIGPSGASTLDITGGAPEMHPEFRSFVERVRHRYPQLEVIVRSNLTILEAHAKYRDLPEFFASMRVRVVSSLPFFRADRTDRQRGEGVFASSLRALRRLTEVGYGRKPELVLDLVHNPAGAYLPSHMEAMEANYRETLDAESIAFNHLIAIANMPISRYLDYLEASGNLEDYLDLLVEGFNPAAARGVMCTNTLSVGWDGTLYDCDFNQMLELPVAHPASNLAEVTDWSDFSTRKVVVANHCYGCTAGAGSSCQGATV
jgi:radical SAM/Cys-rich protein